MKMTTTNSGRKGERNKRVEGRARRSREEEEKKKKKKKRRHGERERK